MRISSDLGASHADRRLPEGELSGKIIGAFFDTYNEVGYGFLEKVYSEALTVLLRERGHAVERERVFNITFHGRVVGRYGADHIVDHRVVVEVKTGTTIPPGTREQLQNYLRVSRLQVGLILFFGPTPEFKRVVFTRAPEDQI